MKRTEIKKLLPSVMQRSMNEHSPFDETDNGETDSVLSTFIKVMEKMHKPTEDLLDNLHNIFNPRQVPEHFLPMLAHWTNLINLFQPDKAGSEPSLWKDRTLPTEPGYLRELIATSVEISQWRGTNYGLKKVLQIATGISNFSIKETDKPFHVQVGVPREGQKYWELIQRIVEQEKPAHITAEIFIVSDSDQSSDSEYFDDNQSSADSYGEDDGPEDYHYDDDDGYYDDEGDDQYYDDENEDDDQYYDDEDEDDDGYDDHEDDQHYDDEVEDRRPRHHVSNRDAVDKKVKRRSSSKVQSESSNERAKPSSSNNRKSSKPLSKPSTNNKKAGKPASSRQSGKSTSKPTGSKRPGKPSDSQKTGRPPRGKKPKR